VLSGRASRPLAGEEVSAAECKLK